ETGRQAVLVHGRELTDVERRAWSAAATEAGSPLRLLVRDGDDLLFEVADSGATAAELDQPHVGIGRRPVVPVDVACDSEPGYEVDDLVPRAGAVGEPILAPEAPGIDARNVPDAHAAGRLHVPLVPLVGAVAGGLPA